MSVRLAPLANSAGAEGRYFVNNSDFLVLRTARLELIAATLELALLELQSPRALGAALSTIEPRSWPPPLNDEHSQRWFLEKLAQEPRTVGWNMWYFVLPLDSRRELIGNGGFKGPPKDNVVELGYSILPEFHRNGYATEAVRALIRWAFSHLDVDRVAAETLPDLEPSLGVMRNCGMKYVGPGNPEEGAATVHYEISLAEWDSLFGKS